MINILVLVISTFLSLDTFANMCDEDRNDDVLLSMLPIKKGNIIDRKALSKMNYSMSKRNNRVIGMSFPKINGAKDIIVRVNSDGTVSNIGFKKVDGSEHLIIFNYINGECVVSSKSDVFRGNEGAFYSIFDQRLDLCIDLHNYYKSNPSALSCVSGGHNKKLAKLLNSKPMSSEMSELNNKSIKKSFMPYSQMGILNNDIHFWRNIPSTELMFKGRHAISGYPVKKETAINKAYSEYEACKKESSIAKVLSNKSLVSEIVSQESIRFKKEKREGESKAVK